MATTTAVALTSCSHPSQCSHLGSTDLHHADVFIRHIAGGTGTCRQRYMQEEVHAGRGCPLVLGGLQVLAESQSNHGRLSCARLRLCDHIPPCTRTATRHLVITCKSFIDAAGAPDTCCTSSSGCTGGSVACDHACCHSGSGCAGRTPCSDPLTFTNYVSRQVNDEWKEPLVLAARVLPKIINDRLHM